MTMRTNSCFIAPIVEGHGEIEALPALLYRIAAICGAPRPLRVNKPIRVKAGSLMNDVAYLRKHVALAAAKAAQERGSVLILLDCEDDCPAKLGPRLLEDAQSVRVDVPCVVALIRREYETWFLAAAASLAGENGLDPLLASPANPESLRDAKGWLTQHMQTTYDPVIHQLALSRAMDLDQARTNASFDRLYRKIAALLQTAP